MALMILTPDSAPVSTLIRYARAILSPMSSPPPPPPPAPPPLAASVPHPINTPAVTSITGAIGVPCSSSSALLLFNKPG